MMLYNLIWYYAYYLSILKPDLSLYDPRHDAENMYCREPH